MNTLFALGTWFTPSTIEKGGRRRIMLWTSVLLTVFMLIFVVMINLGDKKSNATQWTAVASVVAYMFFFGYGWVGIPWLYGPEIAPIRYRTLGGSFGATGEWSMTFVTVFAGGIALQRVGPVIWVWFLVFCFVTVVYVYFCCPETGGKTLEEIDLIFMKNPPTAPLGDAENAVDDERSANGAKNTSNSTIEENEFVPKSD
ncbi:hypothetical protein LTR84_003792 [Exophiala bonariae]|uniref:Major facilitator superfamily (MFS) profile domain-containing protein n=1 Tax=Exophiala bonariae TaxID=1690606 RepID=A0AAV9N9V5_9EURO|nr:hypothetical protein LTR84_003792 [Exophiala bonariae]